MVTSLRAVVVGINEYKDKRTRDQSRLEFACKDAEAIAGLLGASPPLRLEQLKYYRDTEAHSKVVWAGLQEVFSDHFPGYNTIALFYFAGHGLHNRMDDRIWLCCHNVDFQHPNDGGIRLNDIYELLMRCSAEYAIAIIDACYSGGIIDSGYFYHKSPAEHAKSAIEAIRGTSDKTIAIFASCRDNQKARESKEMRHGIYTAKLLQGWGKGDACRRDGSVTLFGLADYMTNAFTTDTLVPRVSILGSKPVILWRGEPPPPVPPVRPPQPPQPDDSITFRPGFQTLPRKKPY